MKSYKTTFVNGKQKRLHRYVMECFLQRELSEDEIVHHKNGNMYDNKISNLEIMTRAEHKKIHPEIGLNTRIKNIYSLDVDKIKKMYATKTLQEIADFYGCSVGAIQRVAGNKPILRCKICSDKASYRKKLLCNRCYQKEYRKTNNGN